MQDKRKQTLKIISRLLIISGVLILFVTYQNVIYLELKYRVEKYLGYKYYLKTESIKIGDLTAPSQKVKQIAITPVNTTFSLVIESLNINAPVVKDVPIIDRNKYLDALQRGVAHASFSNYPNEEGARVYIFAHSSYNFWELGKYSSVFNQLNKINDGDEINLFYEGKRYVYKVDNKEFVNDFKIDETIYSGLGPSLTLQTCHPAGTTLYRLVVKASLIKVIDWFSYLIPRVYKSVWSPDLKVVRMISLSPLIEV